MREVYQQKTIFKLTQYAIEHCVLRQVETSLYSFLLPGPVKNQTAMPMSGNTSTPKIHRIFSAPGADDCRILIIAKISNTKMSKAIIEAMFFPLR